MSTSIGEVSINLRLSMAKFANDVQTGSTAVQQASNQMGDAVTSGAGKSREALRLLSEDIGVTLPRGLQSFIAGLPGVSTALTAAFTATAVIAFAEVIMKAIEAIEAFKQHAQDMLTALNGVGTEGSEAIHKTNESILEAGEQMDDLTGNHLAALQKSFQRLDDQSLDTLTGALKSVSGELDGVLGKLKKSTTVNLFHILWGATDPNAGIAQVKDFFTQIQADLARFQQTGNVQGYGNVLASALREAQGAATGLSNQAPVVQQAWAAVATELQLMQQDFTKVNQAANLKKAVDSFKDVKSQADKTEASFDQVGSAWTEMQDKILSTAQKTPTAGIVKGLNDALDSIDRFTAAARGVWSEYDILAATSTARTQAFANEWKEMWKFVSSLSSGRAALSLPVYVPDAELSRLSTLEATLENIQQVGVSGDSARAAEAQKVIDATETQNQKFKIQVQILQTLAKSGSITTDEMSRGIQQATLALQKSTPGWVQLAHSVQSDFTQAFDSILSGTTSAVAGFEKLAQSILLAIAKMEILTALNDSDFFGKLGGGHLFGSGGLFAGRAEGGPVDAGTPYWVGERRTPELFVPKTPGTIVPISQIHSGGSGGHTTNIHMEVNTPNADSFGKSQGQLLSDAYRNARVASAQNRGR